MAEGQQAQGDATQVSAQDASGGQAPPQPPQIDTNAIAAAARRDGEESGYQKAARDLGVTVEEAKTIIQDAKKRADSEKSAQEKLSEREVELGSVKEEATSHKQRADRYEKIVKSAVGNQLELVGDDAIKELLSGMDVGAQFEWLQKHGARYVQAQSQPQEQLPPQDDNQAFLQRLRGPDATPSGETSPLTDANKQMNDLLRVRGLGGS